MMKTHVSNRSDADLFMSNIDQTKYKNYELEWRENICFTFFDHEEQKNVNSTHLIQLLRRIFFVHFPYQSHKK